MRSFAADVLREETLDQVVDGRGPALGRDLGQGVATGIDQALKPARLFAGGRCLPVGEGPNRVAPLATGTGAVPQDKGAITGCGDPRAEALHVCVVSDGVAIRREPAGA